MNNENTTKRTDCIGWLGAVSLLSGEEEAHARYNFENSLSETVEMRAIRDLEGVSFDRKTQMYLETCTQITTTALINMMNTNLEDGQLPPSEKIVIGMIEKSQRTVAKMMESKGVVSCSRR